MDQQIIPQFSPSYLPINGRTLEWGKKNIIAYTTGCCIHLSHADGSKLNRICSYDFSPNPITCLSIHPHNNVIAVGDDHGRIFLWDIDKRKIVAHAKPLKTNDSCLYMKWHGDILTVLMKSRKFIGIAYTSGSVSENIKNLTLLWEIILSNDFNKFSIDPHFGHFILFSGNIPVLSIYKITSPEERPVSYIESITLTQTDEIQDAQWSLHLPGYAYIVLSSEIMFFHTQSRSLIPLITQRTSSSSYLYLLQFTHDYSRFMTFHRNGLISIYEANSQAHFRLADEFQPKHSLGSIVYATLSPLHDDQIVFFFSSLGLALFDMNVKRIVSIGPIFPSTVSAFDCDGTGFALGTNNGFVITGSVYDWKETKRYYVSEGAVTFVCIDAVLSRVYWQTSNHIGVVNLIKKCVEPLPTKGLPVMRCFGSQNGGLIVQRDENLIGVFVEGKERPLLLPLGVKDISLDEGISTASSGSFCALLKNQEVHFYQYSSKNSSIDKISGMKPRGVESEALCFAVHGSMFVTGFADGVLLFYDKSTKQANKVTTSYSNLRKLRFCSHGLYGLGNESTLFMYSRELIICPFGATNYQIVSDTLILIQSTDGILRFLSLPEWTQLQHISTFMPSPPEDLMISKFVKEYLHSEPDFNQNIFPYYSPEARDVWLCLSGIKSLTLQAKAGIGEPGLIEKVNCALLDIVETNTPELYQLKYTNLIYANRFDEAATLIFSNIVNSEDSFLTTMFAACLLSIENGANEKTLVHLKSSAIAMLENGNFEKAALLLRIGKLDSLAVQYLIEYGQDELAMRFIMNCLDSEGKKPFLFRFGCKMMQEDKLREAVPFFAGSGEFHAVLFALFSLGLVVDAYFLMKYLQKVGKLKELSENFLKQFPEIEDLPSLIDLIEQQFLIIMNKLKLNKDNSC